MDTMDTNEIVLMSVEGRRREIPGIATRIVLGATISQYQNNKDAKKITDVYGSKVVHNVDFDLIMTVVDRLMLEFDIGRVIPPYVILEIRERAQSIVDGMNDERSGKHGVVMLIDKGGCGYWRGVLPSRNINDVNMCIDITKGSVDSRQLMDYQTIFIQRLHDWDSVEVLRKLKKAGKRIVYDIDDDLFNLPDGNPAARIIGRNEQFAALECMKIADVVTTTTYALQERLTTLLDGKAPLIIPNAHDFDSGWVRTDKIGSPDGVKRIFWQGSNTHEEDWGECFEAVNEVMSKHDDVRMVIIGYLPNCVRDMVSSGTVWRGRVEYLSPMEPEVYFNLVHNVRAEVGLAPLASNFFNEAKSPIKWIENAMMGMPTVASNVRAYSDYIGDGEGFLCTTTQEWIDAIEACLMNENLRKSMVAKARSRIVDEFNIKKTSKTWRDVLLG